MRQTRLLTATCLTVFLVLPQAAPTGQSPGQQSAAPQVTFRAATNFVEVDAVITDAQGNFVRDLTAADFEVFEDGRPMSVDTFALVDIPIERADTAAAEAAEAAADEAFYAEIVTNEHDFDGRIYLIVLDANHVAPLRTTHVKELARQFVLENMSGSDQAAVVHLGNESISQDFTSNRRLLLDSIDRFMGQKLRSAVLNKFDDATLKAGAEEGLGEPRDNEAIERAAMARQTMQSIRNLADYMKGVRGRRKAMLLVSEGLSSNMYDTIGPSRLGYDLYRDNDSTEAQYAANIALDMQNMIETATRANVVIYSVDPRGLTSEADEAILLTGAVGEGGLMGGAGDVDAVDTSGGDSPTAPESVIRGLREELNRSHTQLRSVAEQTGGTAIVNTNSFDVGFERIVQDNSTYYLLGYNTEPAYDGKFHEITVRVNRPGLEVRARKGYYAAKEDPAASGEPVDVLRDLLASPMPMAGLTMRVGSQVFRGEVTGGLVQIAVEFDGEAVPFVDREGAFANTIELSYLAFDLNGNAQNRGSKILDLSLRPENRDAVTEHGLRFATELALAPGRYQMRLAAKESVGGSSGSVFWDVVVPEFTAPLSLSDVVLVSARAAAAPTVNDAVTLKETLAGVPATTRAFDLEDTVTVFAEAYTAQPATPQEIEFIVTVRADDGFELLREAQTRSTSELAPGDRGLAFSRSLPLIDLVPGQFVLDIEVRSSAGGDPITRTVPFEIR